MRAFVLMLMALLPAPSAEIQVAAGAAGEPPRIPAFPGAEGSGAYSTGGRGGTVYRVTNLNGTGPGSLADAVSQPNRMVVFSVSGIIDLTDSSAGRPRGGKLVIAQPNLTIAGQTAPGEGICIKGGTLRVEASNLIIRHLRVRRGFISEGDAGDSVELNSKDPGYVKPKFQGTEKDPSKEKPAAGRTLKPIENVLFDHISASWATDENFTVSGHIDKVHVQHSLIAEALDYANPKQTPLKHAFGSLLGGAGQDTHVGVHHSIFAHHRRRTPQCSAGDGSGNPPVVVDFRNNVVYDSIEAFSHTGGHPIRLNFVGNYYQTGPSSGAHLRGKWFTMQKSPDSLMHASGNFVFGSPEATRDNWKGVLFEKGVKFLPGMLRDREFDVPRIATQTAEAAYVDNLDHAGATLPARDAVDLRIVRQIRTGTGRVIERETDLPEDRRWPDYRALPAPADTDADGMPDYWEGQFGLGIKDSSDSAGISAGGYANIEHYLNNTDPTGGGKAVVFISAAVSRALAGREQPGEWRIFRTGEAGKALTVSYTIGGDARSGVDYAPLSGTVTIPEGKNSVLLPLAPLAGAGHNRTVVVKLASGQGQYAIGCPAASLVVILR